MDLEQKIQTDEQTPAMRREMLIRFDSLRNEITLLREANAAHWEAHIREHTIVTEMLKKTEVQLNGRLENMNELRNQITNERHTYITRDAVDERMNAVNSKIDERSGSVAGQMQAVHNQLSSRVENIEKMNANLQGRLWALGVGLTIAMFLAHYIWK